MVNCGDEARAELLGLQHGSEIILGLVYSHEHWA